MNVGRLESSRGLPTQAGRHRQEKDGAFQQRERDTQVNKSSRRSSSHRQWFTCRCTRRRCLRNLQQSHTFKTANVPGDTCRFTQANPFSHVLFLLPLQSRRSQRQKRVYRRDRKIKMKNNEADTFFLLYSRPELGEGRALNWNSLTL